MKCWNSGARVTLSVDEELRRQARCSRCGRVLKIRPVREDDNPVATMPQHNDR